MHRFMQKLASAFKFGEGSVYDGQQCIYSILIYVCKDI